MADLIEAFDHATEDTLTPWYRDQVERDHRRAARMRAILEGRPPGPGSDPVLQLIAAGQNDPDAARGFLDVFSILALPAEVLQRPGISQTLDRADSSAPPTPTPGPSRDELVALTQ